MAGIVLDSVAKVYDGNVRAVDCVDLTVADGEFVVLVGPSGCGKSTLLRMIAGLEHITEGTVRIGEKDVTNAAPRDRDIAMVFQNYALYPQMKVRDNLAFGLKLRKTPKAEREQRVLEVATILGLEELLDRKPGQLSGGQRQRVAMGRAMVREPAVYLMDEPLSNLDAKLRVSMRAELARLHERLRTTTVYVTHDQVEAMTLGERVVVLRDGVIQQVAPPKELYDAPANLFVAAFIGSPQMNLLEATVEDGAITSAGMRIPIRGDRVPAGLQRVILGIRPTDVALAAASDTLPQLRGTVTVFEDLGAEAHAIMPVESRRVSSDAAEAASEASSDDDGALIGNDDRTQFVAKVDSRSGVSVGSELVLTIDPDRIHLFDPASGLALV
ncbi:MAG: sn-glycerol-3-phosphate ABC transporter ATP-binding protein UgpC [Actinobacteria bacterium]|nr:sn-glycerol-3-phosphate ABC transporter ATP-binding protein UgpC [Actinomycetota bacterium]